MLMQVANDRSFFKVLQIRFVVKQILFQPAAVHSNALTSADCVYTVSIVIYKTSSSTLRDRA